MPISRYCEISGVDEALVRAAIRRIAAASSVAAFEDLGVQMNRHSTLVSYLEKLVWLLTGNLANPGWAVRDDRHRQRAADEPQRTAPDHRTGLAGRRGEGHRRADPVQRARRRRSSPITRKRYRAMFVESGNPVHSVADSQRMREAMRALDVSVCIDVFMTETARESDYVLPATTQFEKFEATFFNFEYPKNVFHLRRPVLDPPAGPLPEPEIHARIVEALGILDDGRRRGAARGRGAQPRRVRRQRSRRRRPPIRRLGSGRCRSLLYRTLGSDASARRGGRCVAVADGDPLLAGQPRRRRPRRLRHRTRCR